MEVFKDPKFPLESDIEGNLNIKIKKINTTFENTLVEDENDLLDFVKRQSESGTTDENDRLTLDKMADIHVCDQKI